MTSHDEKVMEQAREANLMGAIKLHQETYHISLEEAKQYIKELMQNQEK